MTHDPSLIGIGDEAVSLLDVVQENPDLVTVSQEIGVVFIPPIGLVARHSSLKCPSHLPPPLERVWHLMIPISAQRDNALLMELVPGVRFELTILLVMNQSGASDIGASG
jgi:hypothetical protein